MIVAFGLHAGRLPLKSRVADELVTQRLQGVPLTQLSNPTAIPSKSALLHWAAPEPCRTGMSLGVQSVACFGNEVTMLQLAGQRRHRAAMG